MSEPTNHERAVERALLLSGAGRAREALQLLLDSGAAAESDRAARLLVALHADLGDLDAARLAAEDLVSRVPESPAAWYLRGEVARLQDELGTAETAFLRALGLDPTHVDSWAAYAWCCAAAGQAEKAEALIARALALEPEDTTSHRHSARIAWLAGRDGLARERTLALLSLDPQDRDAHQLLGILALGRDRLAQAEQHLRTAVLADPRDQDTADLAREVRRRRHWTMLPNTIVDRIGGDAVAYGLFIGGGLALVNLDWGLAGAVLIWTWVGLAVWSWIAPRLAERLVDG